MKMNLLKILFRNLGAFEILTLFREIPYQIKGRLQFNRDKKAYKKCNSTNFIVNYRYVYPCLTDRYKDAGTGGGYFWMDLWCARLIAENNPHEHYDIGSRLDGFIAHLASFRGNIHLIDIRALDMDIPGVAFKQEDATNLQGIPDNSIESISALCSLEHFGLGRYGDPVDPDACFKAMQSISRVIMPGGHAYISVPIGWEHLEFNAHRIFYASTIIDSFKDLELIEFSATNGNGIEKNISIIKYDAEMDNRGSRFGLFHFKKRENHVNVECTNEISRLGTMNK